MEQYTIYCTEEQTRKALDLGAPITSYENAFISTAVPHFSVGIDDKNWVEYICPTAERMIGWLETKVELGLHVWRGKDYYGFSLWDGVEEIKYRVDLATRKEATLAAIDEALDYLESHLN